jgi:hypothetical protein
MRRLIMPHLPEPWGRTPHAHRLDAEIARADDPKCPPLDRHSAVSR